MAEDLSVSRWRRGLANLSGALLPDLNFITLHYIYFIATGLVSAVIFYVSSTPFKSVSFTDSLFLCISAMTEAGLNTVNLSTLNTWQQFMLFFLIMIGSSIFVSIFVVFVRLKTFHREFKRTIAVRRHERQRSKSRAGESGGWRRRTNSARTSDPGVEARLEKGLPPLSPIPISEQALQDDPNSVEDMTKDWFRPDEKRSDSSPKPDEHRGRSPGANHNIRFELAPHRSGRNIDHVLTSPPGLQLLKTSDGQHNRQASENHSFFSFTGIGATASSSLRPRSSTRGADALASPISTAGSEEPTSRWFPSSAGHFTKNSSVYGLTLDERQELGGREYYSILFLSFLVPIYFIVWQLLGSIACGAWIANHRASTARENGINPWWLGAFNAVSAFNNSGMSLLDANMTAFQDSIFLLISMGLFVLAGNTAYPIFLRAAVWALWRIMPEGDYWRHEKETLRFLLDHPRRCYTNLFPSQHTWWLGLTLLTLNGIDWAMFEILNIGNTAVTDLKDGVEALDGLFQALAVRSGGFYVVPIASTRISLQVLYVVMMFISAYPVAITMRNSNIYEERSLGIFSEDLQDQRDEAADAASKRPATRNSDEGPFRSLRWMAQARTREQTTGFLRQQLRAQLSHDAWWLALAVFIISIVENSSFEKDPAVFSLFNILFEVVSGYACCGISVGVPWAAYSFCGEWHALSKLVMCAVMIRGRHRGLPVAIDRAVQLPGQRVWEAEEEDARLRLERSAATAAVASACAV